jgi:hypothetical protein
MEEKSEIHRKEEIYLTDIESPLQEATVNKVTPWSNTVETHTMKRSPSSP